MSTRNMVEVAILTSYLLESSSDDDSDNNQRPPQRILSLWSKNWLLQRENEGFCAKLMRELLAEEPELYQNFLRISATQFDFLLNLVASLIQKENTNMRTSISTDVRLVLTLRYLASGDNFKSLQYLFRITQPTITCIIPEVLDAILKVEGAGNGFYPGTHSIVLMGVADADYKLVYVDVVRNGKFSDGGV